MPIRTNRGRAAVYRRLWGAPMRSPKHLAVTVVVLAGLIVLGGFTLPRLSGGPGGSDAVSASAHGSAQHDTPVAHSRNLDTPHGPLTTPPSVAPAQQALTVARQWATAWVDHPEGMTTQEWLAELEPYTTSEFLPQLRNIRLGNIPSSEVTGAAEPLSSHTKSLVARIPTDGPDLRVTVIDTDDGWRVTRYEQAE